MGKIYDEHGNHIAYLEDGKYIDRQGNILAYFEDGKILDVHGNVTGYGEEGTLLDQQGNRFGYYENGKILDKNGRIVGYYDETNDDAEENKSIYDNTNKKEADKTETDISSNTFNMPDIPNISGIGGSIGLVLFIVVCYMLYQFVLKGWIDYFADIEVMGGQGYAKCILSLVPIISLSWLGIKVTKEKINNSIVRMLMIYLLIFLTILIENSISGITWSTTGFSLVMVSLGMSIIPVILVMIVSIFIIVDKSNEKKLGFNSINRIEGIVLSLLYVISFVILGISSGGNKDIVDSLKDQVGIGNQYDNMDLGLINSNNRYGGCQAVTKDGSIYFVSDDMSIVRVDDNDSYTTIVGGQGCIALGIYDDRLYYNSNQDHYIYSVNLEGDDPKLEIEEGSDWFAVYNDRVYYINGYWDYSSVDDERMGDTCLYSKDIYTGETVRLTNCETSNVNFTEDGIIYIDNDNNEIVSYNESADEFKIIYTMEEYEMEGNTSYVYYAGKLYYYFAEYGDYGITPVSGIYEMDTDSAEVNKVNDFCGSYFSLYRGQLLTVEEDGVVELTAIEGGDGKVISEEVYGVSEMTVLGNEMISHSDDKIMSLNLDSGESKIITNKKTKNMIYYNDRLFYTSCPDDLYIGYNDLNILDTKTKNIDKIVDSGVEYIWGSESVYYNGEAMNSNGDYDTGLFEINVDDESINWITNEDISELVVDDRFIYYTNEERNIVRKSKSLELGVEDEDYEYRIYSMDGYEDASPLFIVDNELYFKSDYYISDSDWAKQMICRLDLDDGSITEVLDCNTHLYGYALYEDSIYFCSVEESADDTQLMVYSILNESLGTIGSVIMQDYSRMCFYNDMIYYIDGYSGWVIRMSLDGSGKEKVTDFEASGLTMGDDCLYVINMFDDGAVYIIDDNSVSKFADTNGDYDDVSDGFVLD